MAAPYAVWIGNAETAAPDEMFTIEPLPRSTMCGATRWESTNALFRLRSIMFWKRSAVQSSNAYEWLPPALLTSTSTRPNVCQRLVDQVLALLDVAHVGGDDVGASPGLRLHLGRDPLEVLGLAAGQHDVGAVLGEEQRGRRADPGATAGHHRHFAAVIEHVVHTADRRSRPLERATGRFA